MNTRQWAPVAFALTLLLGITTNMQVAAESWEFEDLIFTSDDSTPRNPGCEAISVIHAETGHGIHYGTWRISPGILAANSDGSLVASISSNQFQGLHVLRRQGSDPSTWLSSYIGSSIADYGNTLAISPNDEFILIQTRSGFASFPLSAIERGRLGDRVADNRTIRAVEFVYSPDSQFVHVVSKEGFVHTLSSTTLEEVRAPIPFTQVRIAQRRGRNTHAALLESGRYMVVNSGGNGAINILDLELRTGVTVPAEGLSETWGLAIDYRGRNRGRLAVHGRNRVAVYDVSEPASIELLTSTSVASQSFNAWGTYTRIARPATLAWTGAGDGVIAAVGMKREYQILDVSEGPPVEISRRLEFDSCGAPNGETLQTDVLTLNTIPTPTPSIPTATATATPSPTTTATPTPNPTDAPATETPLPPPTETPPPTPAPPAPIYLPILLRESCTPDQQRADVALVVDASTSMLETTAAGRSKLAAAIAAAGTFLDQLRLDAGDQAAIVSFNADAVLRTELTALRPILDAALASITPASQTCLVCGVDVAATELASARHRADNTPVLILLTDGLSNPRPASEAVQRAAEAKAAGVVIHTIGLGDTLDFEALEAMASEPDDFHRAPDAEDLAAIYAQIAVEIPCPPSRYWGRR